MGLIGLVYTNIASLVSALALIGLVYTNIASLVSALALSTLFYFLFSLQILFCLHPIFFVYIVTGFGFLFASNLFCLHPIFFVCSKPFFIALTLVGHCTGQVHFHLITAN